MVTGATSGIGRAAALQFAEEGAKVVFCGRREALGREVEQLIRSRQGEATYIRADVRQEKDVEAFVAAAVRQYGRLDVAFNNAGITVEKPLHEYTSAEWDDVHHTNVRGVFLAMKYQLPHMIAAKKGSIVVTSSTAALSSTAKTDFVRRLAGMANLPDLVWDVAISQWAKAKLPGDKRLATPEEVAAHPDSYTGQFLAKLLPSTTARPEQPAAVANKPDARPPRKEKPEKKTAAKKATATTGKKKVS